MKLFIEPAEMKAKYEASPVWLKALMSAWTDALNYSWGLFFVYQMIGVLVLAISLPRMFASIERGEQPDNSVMVLGYVIMRVALVFNGCGRPNRILLDAAPASPTRTPARSPRSAERC